MEDVCHVQETLRSIRERAGLFLYRKFLYPLHCGIATLTQDPTQFRIYNTSSREYVNVALLTDKAFHLLTLLGFAVEGAIMRLPPGCSLPEVWSAFLEACVGDIIVSKGDPVALIPLPDKTSVPNLVVRLFYHMHVRIQLLTSSTPSYLRQSLIKDVAKSFAAIDEVAKRLQVLDTASPSGIKWETASVMVQVFLESGGERIGDDYAAVVESIKREILQRIQNKSVHDIIPYLQNMQAVANNTSLGEMMRVDDVTKYLRTVNEFPRSCVRTEYTDSMVAIEKLMKESQRRTLTAAEIEKLHLTVVWQTENFVRCFNPEFLESDETAQLATDVSFELRKVPVTAEVAKQMLTTALESLEEAVGFFLKRSFVEVIGFPVSCILESRGSLLTRIINKGDPTVSSVSSQTGLALDIMAILGFHEHKSLPNRMILADYEASEATLKTYSNIAKEMLLLNLEGIPLVHSIDDVVTLTAFLACTLHIRFYLVCVYTPDYLRFHIRDAVRIAVADFDIAIDRLELCRPESRSRAIWMNLKAQCLAFPQTPNPGEAIQELSKNTDDLGEALVNEMTEIFPKSLIDFIGYLQNVSAIVSNTKYGIDLNQEAAFLFLRNSEHLIQNSLSTEFMEHNRVLRQIMDGALRREFTYEQTVSIHQRTVWQACHFLSHLRAGEMDMEVCSTRLVALARRQGLRLSPTLAAEAVPVRLPLVSAGRESGGDSDEGEKMEKDKSEKEERGLVTDRSCVRKLFEETNNGGDLAALLEDYDSDVALEELKTLTEDKATEMESLKRGLSEINEVLASDQPPIVKTALMDARERAMQGVQKAGVKLNTLKQILHKLNIKDGSRTLDASLSDEMLYSILRRIGLFHGDVHVIRNLIVSGFDMMPAKAADLISSILEI